VLLNTHFDAFADSSETMLNQVRKADAVVSALEAANLPWILGGDFNLLPPVPSDRFPAHVASHYSELTELKLLYDTYPAIPSLEALQQASIDAWFTHFPNHPAIRQPDRIIDYLFYSPSLELHGAAEVMHGDTYDYSDHLPIRATFKLKTASHP
jgi:endonuclease/exonuclease/phosphatase family metal-dependent hydrolase